MGTARTRKRDPNVYPKGWNRKRVEEILAYYEHQTDAEAEAEYECKPRRGYVMIEVPFGLVMRVRMLIAKSRTTHATEDEIDLADLEQAIAEDKRTKAKPVPLDAVRPAMTRIKKIRKH